MITIDKNYSEYNTFKSKCSECKHFDVSYISCLAFQENIPKDFLNGNKIHSKPLPTKGNDIVFEKLKD